ncbi:MAG: hypothetical protein EON96_22835 [Caulobacteraceae bacterium]|nr:MAG: hypothetical protein EON96_22835 [Caulobacteraceae bacterium]
MAEDALIRVRRALRLGRAGEAASWMRLHEKLLARLEAERQAVARRDRVARGQGAAGVVAPLTDALRAVRDHAAIAAGLTGNRLRIVRAHRQGDISDATFDSLFDLQFDAETALRLAIAPPDVRPADPHLPHPDFSTAPDP